MRSAFPKDSFLRNLEPSLARATDVAVMMPFVRSSTMLVLHDSLQEALGRGTRVRLLTGDSPTAEQARELLRLLDWMDANEQQRERGEGLFEARVWEKEQLGGGLHTSSWRFEGPEQAEVLLGSGEGEASPRLERASDAGMYQQVVDSFEDAWSRAQRFDLAWWEEFRARVRPEGLIVPNVIQADALAALANSRKRGHQRALVVMATGLGKTLLSVLDIAAFEKERGRSVRVLFLAHRMELLDQAAETFRRLRPESRLGWFVADRSDLEGDVVFASVQKLSRPEHLFRLRQATPFDYVVVDEVHHADAPSYRAILGSLEPAFLLGLTATPERSDEGDILGLFDDHLAYRVDLGEAIAQGYLVPFAYYGLMDDIAYENIPWHNRRFDTEKLAEAVQTEARMRRMWRAWEEHPARQTLLFCCSIAHAEYTCDWLRNRGVRVAAVHSALKADARAEALRRLEGGELDALCSVDVLNEGVNLPSVDRVVMLRPTESLVVFLQQIGRGLRRAPGKASLTVIDFVGNHRVFLDRLRGLLALGTGKERLSLRDYLVEGKQPELPPGCSVQVELKAKELLSWLLPSKGSVLVDAYRELREARNARPTAVELHRMGCSPRSLRATYGGWLRFVQSEGDLTADEAQALEAGADWFDDLETMGMAKSFKMVLLKALLDAGALGVGMPLRELAIRSQAILYRSRELSKDLARELEGVQALTGEGRAPEPERFLEYWKNNPIKAWADSRWFGLEGEDFIVRLPIPETAREAFLDLTRELVDYRFALYRDRRHLEMEEGSSFEAKVLSNGKEPILKLPSRAKRPGLPSGELEVRLPDGRRWRFRMMKEFCKVAQLVGARQNALPELLRDWFGPAAGKPGTAFYVRFSEGPEGWRVEPVTNATVTA
jgi:superfamily II DNA or RNA helicase